MGKRMLLRNLDDPRMRAIWENIKRTAERVRQWPAWKRGGVDLNPEHFETYPPEDEP